MTLDAPRRCKAFKTRRIRDCSYAKVFILNEEIGEWPGIFVAYVKHSGLWVTDGTRDSPCLVRVFVDLGVDTVFGRVNRQGQERRQQQRQRPNTRISPLRRQSAPSSVKMTWVSWRFGTDNGNRRSLRGDKQKIVVLAYSILWKVLFQRVSPKKWRAS